jgi:hypothetical protein
MIMSLPSSFCCLAPSLPRRPLSRLPRRNVPRSSYRLLRQRCHGHRVCSAGIVRKRAGVRPVWRAATGSELSSGRTRPLSDSRGRATRSAAPRRLAAVFEAIRNKMNQG